MSDDQSHDTGTPKARRIGCAIAVLVVSVLLVLAIGSVLYSLSVAFTSLELHRDKMCLSRDLTIREHYLRYSPGMDAVMWCRITVEANDIDEVFDPSRVDTSELREVGYQIRNATPITNQWWDVEQRNLRGGEVQVDGASMRVAYEDNGDETLTVYIFWFEF